MNETAVREWLETELQKPRFRGNLSELARAAGDMSISTLHAVRSKGRAEPETLLRLGAAVGKTPREMLTLAGWLPEEETTAADLALTETEVAMVMEFRQLSQTAQQFLLRGLGVEESPLTDHQPLPAHLRAAERPESRYTASP